MYISPPQNRGKLNKKCWKGIFDGYDSRTSKIFHIWYPDKKILYEAQSIEFDENDFPIDDKLHNIPNLKLLTGDESDHNELDKNKNARDISNARALSITSIEKEPQLSEQELDDNPSNNHI